MKLGKIFKWTAIILAILLVLIIGAAILIPYLYGDKIEAEVKEQVNAQLNAIVDWGDWDVTLFKSFPDGTFEVDDVRVINKAPFDSLELAHIGRFDATFDLMSLLRDRIELERVDIRQMRGYFKVLEDGTANWDITLPDSSAAEVGTTDTTKFNIGLKRYSISESSITYEDLSMPMLLKVENFDHEGKGDFTQDLFTLSTTTTGEKVKFVYDGITYLRGSSADIDADLEMDMPNMKFTFKDNEARIDRLVLGMDGWVAMPADDIDMDLKWNTKRNDLAAVLSLVPAEFAKDLEGVEMEGKSTFAGYVKGTYNEETMPGFGLDMSVENGMFNYPDLPEQVEDIQLVCSIKSPQGNDLDGMVIDLSKFHMSLAGQPIDARLYLTRPISDPNIDASVKTRLDLGLISKVVPMEDDERLQGIVDADVTLKGKMSDIEAERYNGFHASGRATITDMIYTSRTTGIPVDIRNMVMEFDPRFVDMTAFDGKLGGSDLQATGRVENYLGWYLKEEPLTGRFTLGSGKFDLNELMASSGEEAPAGEAASSDTLMTVFEVPKNLDVELDADIKQVLFDDLVLTDAKGMMVIRNEELDMKGVTFRMFEGTVAMDGKYNTQDKKRPRVDLKYDIQKMDIQKTVAKVNSVQKLAPIAMSTTGKFSTQLEMTCAMDEQMEFLMSTINGKGTLKTHGVTIEKFRPLTEIARTLKVDRLSEPAIADCNFSYRFTDGKMITDPFNVKIDQVQANVGGWTAFADQSIEYVMKTRMPTELLGNQANNVVQGLLSQANQTMGSNFSVGKEINVDLLITGTITAPKVKPRFAGGSTDIKGTIKEEIKETIKQEVQQVADDVLKKAQEQADKLMTEARTQAQRVRDEASSLSSKTKSEGYAAAKKLEDDAKNPLAKAGAKIAADKLRQETDKKAQQIIDEGNKRADGIVNTAQAQADKLIADAKAKSTVK